MLIAHLDDARGGLAAMLGQEVTLEGIAADQKLGAVLLTGDDVVWIDGLESWPSGYYKGGRDGKRLRVKGRLVEREDLPVFESPPPGGPQRSGVPVPAGTDLRKASRRYVLTKAAEIGTDARFRRLLSAFEKLGAATGT